MVTTTGDGFALRLLEKKAVTSSDREPLKSVGSKRMQLLLFTMLLLLLLRQQSIFLPLRCRKSSEVRGYISVRWVLPRRLSLRFNGGGSLPIGFSEDLKGDT